MNTVFYLLCLMILGQFIFSILIYDMVARRYRYLESKMEKYQSEKTRKEVLYAKLNMCLRMQVSMLKEKRQDIAILIHLEKEIKEYQQQILDEEHGTNTK